jgi:DNA-3-methyladenine glycosylase I
MISRCHRCGEDPLYVKYHYEEWGALLHDDAKPCKFLLLENIGHDYGSMTMQW